MTAGLLYSLRVVYICTCFVRATFNRQRLAAEYVRYTHYPCVLPHVLLVSFLIASALSLLQGRNRFIFHCSWNIQHQ